MQCNWGLLGPGFIASRAIIPAIQQVPHARIVAVASRSAEQAQLTAARFGIERAYHGYQALLNDPDIHAVYIALPNHLHRPWTIRAAQAGKHILCEKPLAMTAAECDEMISATTQANVLLMEAVMYRFHPRMLHLKHMLATGQLGPIRLLHAAFSFTLDAPNNYRTRPECGGGALLDIGSYCVNAARWLIDSEPSNLQVYSSYSQSIDVNTSALMHFEHDVIAHIQCSFAAAEHQVIEVVGSTAAITAPLAFTAWRDDTTALLVQRREQSERIEFAPADPYQAMVAHFTDAVLGRAALLYPPTDGRATLHVLDGLRAGAFR